MDWIAIVLIVIAAYLTIKVVGFLFKVCMVIVVLGGLYWLAAPYFGLPLPF